MAELFQQADIVIEGRVARDTAYLVEGRVYTTFIIEPCKTFKDERRDRDEPIVITRDGGWYEGKLYDRTHGLYIFGHEEGFFFLKSHENDVVTPPGYHSTYVLCQSAGLANYLTDDWKPVVNVGEDEYTPAEFIAEARSSFDPKFEYCSSLKSQFAISPKFSYTDSGLALSLRLEYMTPNQLPPETAIVEVALGNPVAHELKQTISEQTDPAVSIALSVVDSHRMSVSIDVAPLQHYVDGYYNLAVLSFPIEGAANAGDVSLEYVPQNATEGKATFKRIVYEYDDDDVEGFKRVRITGVTEEVVGGIRRAVDLAGSPAQQRLGILEIIGEDFGNYSPAELRSLVPGDVRVELRRESDNPSDTKTISPLPDDIIEWSDDRIELYVPTVGYMDDAGPVIRAGAFTGTVRVVTPSSNDRAPTRTTVYYNQRSNLSQVLNRFSSSSDDVSIRKQWLVGRDLQTRSPERGLTFTYDPSFASALRFGSSDLTAAKEDICDAAAEWTRITSIPIDIVEECPPGVECGEIVGDRIPPTSGNATIAIASGAPESATAACVPEEPRTYSGILTFNTDHPDKVISRAASSVGTGRLVVFDQALHEFGHILSQLHVDDEDELMAVFAQGNTTLTPASIACATHIRNVSRAVPFACANVIDFSSDPTECSTSSIDEVASEEAMRIRYERETHRIRISSTTPQLTQRDFTSALYNSVGQPLTQWDVHSSSEILFLPDLTSGVYVYVVRDQHRDYQQAYRFVVN